MPSPLKKGDSDNSPERHGMKGLVPGLPKHASPRKGEDESSPERFTKDKPVMAPKSGGNKKAPLD